MFVKRFFDTTVAEAGGGASVASMMAQHGVKSEAGMTVEIPTVNIPTEKKEEPPTATIPSHAATANEGELKAETANPEPPPLAEATQEVPQPEIQAEQPKPQSWQEVLKSQQPDTVLKALGFDDNMAKLVGELKTFDPKVVGLIQAYKEGTHVDYLRELATDYTKMSAEEVMRHQLRREYPKASDRQLDVLYRKEVVQQYNLDSDDEFEVEEGRMLLDAKADRYRDDFVNSQQKYLLPKAPEPTAATETDHSAEEAKQRFETYRNQFTGDPYTKNIFAAKQVVLGEGDDKFTFPVKDPESIIKNLYDADSWLQKTSIVQGDSIVPDVKKQVLIALIAEHGEGFLNEYAKHYKSLGGKSVVETIENAKPPETNAPSAADQQPQSVAEFMAKKGIMNFGGR